MVATLSFEDDLDVGRGDLVVTPGAEPVVARELDATVCWMVETPAREGARYLLKHTTRRVRANIVSISARIDIESFSAEPADALGLNDIGRITLRTAAPIVPDAYADNRATGAFILIDERTHDTVAAGMVEAARPGRAAEIEHSPDIRWHPSALDRGVRWSSLDDARRDRLADRAARVGQVDDRGRGRAGAGRVGPLRLPARRRQPAPRALGRPRLRSRLADGEHPPRRPRRAAVRRRGRGRPGVAWSPRSARTGSPRGACTRRRSCRSSRSSSTRRSRSARAATRRASTPAPARAGSPG